MLQQNYNKVRCCKGRYEGALRDHCPSEFFSLLTRTDFKSAQSRLQSTKWCWSQRLTRSNRLSLRSALLTKIRARFNRYAILIGKIRNNLRNDRALRFRTDAFPKMSWRNARRLDRFRLRSSCYFWMLLIFSLLTLLMNGPLALPRNPMLCKWTALKCLTSVIVDDDWLLALYLLFYNHLKVLLQIAYPFEKKNDIIELFLLFFNLQNNK